MKPRLTFQIFVFGILLLIVISAATAFAANLTIPETNVGIRSFPVTIPTLRPPACSGLTLSSIVRGSGIFSGTGTNELIFGDSGDDTITGGGGTDCILAGAGNDICFGAEGTIFIGCETINPLPSPTP